MKNLSNEIEANRINAVQSDFDDHEAKSDELEAEREKEAAEKAHDLRADLEYLIQKHGVTAVTKTIQDLTKQPEGFIMIAESANVGNASVVLVSGETANDEYPRVTTCEKDAKTLAVSLVAQKLNVTAKTATQNGTLSYTEIQFPDYKIPAIYFRSTNKKTGKTASAKVGWYK